MGAEGDYAQTPKASTFHVANAPKRDAEGVERLHLRICVDSVVSSRQHGSPVLMLLTTNSRHISALHSRQRQISLTVTRVQVYSPPGNARAGYSDTSVRLPLCIVVCRFLKFASARLSLVHLCMPILPCPHTSHEKCECIPMCTGPLFASVTLLS